MTPAKLQTRVKEISYMGANRTIVATHDLVDDIVEAICLHFALPPEDVYRVIEDTLDE